MIKNKITWSHIFTVILPIELFWPPFYEHVGGSNKEVTGVFSLVFFFFFKQETWFVTKM